MSASNWADGPTLPLTSWRDGRLVYVSATPLPMTASQAREAAGQLLDHADAIEKSDPHADRVATQNRWEAVHRAGECATCNEWEQRRAGRSCMDCDGGPGPCTCQIAERPHLTAVQAEKLELLR